MEIPYVADEKNGIEKEYYKNGRVMSLTPYKDGEISGAIKYYDEYGNLLQ